MTQNKFLERIVKTKWESILHLWEWQEVLEERSGIPSIQFEDYIEEYEEYPCLYQ